MELFVRTRTLQVGNANCGRKYVKEVQQYNQERNFFIYARSILGKGCRVTRSPKGIAPISNVDKMFNCCSYQRSKCNWKRCGAFENHIHVSSVDEHLTTCDRGVMTGFERECVLGPNDQCPILVKLEHVGWVEKILALNDGLLNIVVLLCNWAKADYVRINTMVKQNEYGFVLLNFAFLIPILDQSFVFPLHVDCFF